MRYMPDEIHLRTPTGAVVRVNTAAVTDGTIMCCLCLARNIMRPATVVKRTIKGRPVDVCYEHAKTWTEVFGATSDDRGFPGRLGPDMARDHDGKGGSESL